MTTNALNETHLTALPHAEPSETLLAGFQPTGDGRLHLGNLLGSITPFIEQSCKAKNSFCMIADIHSLSSGRAPKGLHKAQLQTARELIASGCADEGRVVFLQSDIAAIKRLFTLLCFHCSLGDLRRMTHYEEKKEKVIGDPAGLLLYPTLMAADLLALGATHATVGEDQLQHMELCSTLSQKMNRLYGLTLPTPKALISESTPRVKSLSTPEKKMSKSDPSEMGILYLADCAMVHLQKIKKAQTDPDRLPICLTQLVNRLGAQNLIGIMAALQNESAETTLKPLAGEGFGALKNRLSTALEERLEPFRKRLQLLTDDDVMDHLKIGKLIVSEHSEPIVSHIERSIMRGSKTN